MKARHSLSVGPNRIAQGFPFGGHYLLSLWALVFCVSNSLLGTQKNLLCDPALQSIPSQVWNTTFVPAHTATPIRSASRHPELVRQIPHFLDGRLEFPRCSPYCSKPTDSFYSNARAFAEDFGVEFSKAVFDRRQDTGNFTIVIPLTGAEPLGALLERYASMQKMTGLKFLYLHVNRSLAPRNHATSTLREYLLQEGLYKDPQILVVDTGFNGKMVEVIQEARPANYHGKIEGFLLSKNVGAKNSIPVGGLNLINMPEGYWEGLKAIMEDKESPVPMIPKAYFSSGPTPKSYRNARLRDEILAWWAKFIENGWAPGNGWEGGPVGLGFRKSISHANTLIKGVDGRWRSEIVESTSPEKEAQIQSTILGLEDGLIANPIDRPK